MKISQLSLEGRGAWPDLHVDPLHDQLNVFFGAPRTGKSTIARLLGELLYGKTDSPWREQFRQTVPFTAGMLSVDSAQGQFVLRRLSDENNQTKLTISSSDGKPVDQQTMHSLLANLSPELTTKLFAVDFAESPPVEWLLSDRFSKMYAASQLPSVQAGVCCNNLEKTDHSTTIDRRRIDELVARRNIISNEIEQQLVRKRQEGTVLDQELNDVDLDLSEKRELRDELQDQLRSIEKQIAQAKVRQRYYSLEAIGKADSVKSDQSFQHELDQLESEISRCRQALNDLNTRESTVRSELSQLTADGTADSVTCLADGRTTLSVMERLLDDLDAEVALIARANQPGRCVSHDTHARLSPVAEMLRLQVYTLCGQLTEQERIARRQQFTIEARQIARAQTDLGERLEQLLARRELLIQTNRQAGQPKLLLPEPPANQHCQCDQHGKFVASAEAMQLASHQRAHFESTVQKELSSLELQRAKLVEELSALQQAIQELEQRWKQLQSERAGLIGGASLEENQAELERLENLISQALHQSPAATSSPWRASDILAQLTDGQLVQIHLRHNGQPTTVINSKGNPLSIESLSPAQHDAVYLALTLALVASYASNQIQLPLILDEPFLRQDAPAAARMAGVLQEFALAGHQLFIFTEDLQARRRFESLNSKIFDLDIQRTPPAKTPTPQPTKQTHKATKINTRIVRHSLNGVTQSSRILESSDDSSDFLFYLFESSSFEEFPILGENTVNVFASIGIQTIGDLLTADAKDIALRLNQQNINAATVQLWQSHLALMCFVPEVTLNDAQVLTAIKIHSPSDLYDIAPETVIQRFNQFFASAQGQQFVSARNRYTRAQVNDWIHGARKFRNRWQSSRYQSAKNISRVSKPRRFSQHTVSLQNQEEDRSLRFYLQRSDDIEAAPSIGPKTAKRLSNVGIFTVADLLEADPESTATSLDVSHINTAMIIDWQNQARLCSCIPQLRGYGAQLLVACGYTDPEQIVTVNADEVVRSITTFCNTKKGQRILRNGDAPSEIDIKAWIESAAHSRPLEAA